MMDAKSGTFKPLPEDFFDKEEKEVQKDERILGPLIQVGEIVEIKGVSFQVKWFKPNGKIQLRMVKSGSTL